MKSLVFKIVMFVFCIVCLSGVKAFKVEAKLLEADLKTKAADYSIIREATDTNPGEVSAKLQKNLTVINIPETVSIDNKEYVVTKITGLCYPDYPDASLRQDSYKCEKNNKTKKIMLPKTIRNIEKGTFTNFTKLKTISIDKENTKYKCVKGSVLSKNGKILYGAVTQKGTYKVPKGVRTIASRAFAYSPVKKVILPSGCKKVQARAFYYCTNLKTVKNIKGVKTIGSGAFYKTKLKNVTKNGKLKK